MAEYVTPEGAAAAIAANQQQRLELSKAQLGTYSGTGKTMVVDGSIWKRASGGTANGGTVIAASGGGTWQRQYSGPLDVRWFGVVGDGVVDDTAAFNAALTAAAQRPGTTVNAQGLTIRVSNRINIPGNTTILLDGTVFTVPPEARADNWVGVFVVGLQKHNWHLKGRFRIECNVPDDADELAASTGSTAYVQRGIYIEDCTLWSIDDMTVSKPLMEGIRLANKCVGWRIRSARVEHRDGWTRNPDGSPQNMRAERACVHIASTLAQPAGTKPSTNGFIPSMNRANTGAADTMDGWIDNGEFIGGTHGLLLSNVTRLRVHGVICRDNSHRGIILSPTSDYNTVTNCHTVNSGSTGIHLANGSSYNTFSGCTVNGVLGGEGDGLKLYVGCIGNTFTSCAVNGAYMTGVRVAWGSFRNTFSGITIAAPTGAYGRLGASGLKVMSRTKAQADGYAAEGYTVNGSEIGSNTFTGITIYGYHAGVALFYETPTHANAPAPSETNSALRNNQFSDITVEFCQFMLAFNDERAGYAHNMTSGWVTGNSLSNVKQRGCDQMQLIHTTPGYGYLGDIINVARVGTGWGAPLLSRMSGVSQWAGSGTPTNSAANGDTYIDTATGERYHMIGGAWKKSTVA